MSSDQMSAGKGLAIALTLLVGLSLGARLCWMAYDAWPRGEPQTAEEFRQIMRDMHADDRANLESDWRASGKPLPPGGFDALFEPQPTQGINPTLDPADAPSAMESAAVSE